jgi:hypothetical protein
MSFCSCGSCHRQPLMRPLAGADDFVTRPRARGDGVIRPHKCLINVNVFVGAGYDPSS